MVFCKLKGKNLGWNWLSEILCDFETKIEACLCKLLYGF